MEHDSNTDVAGCIPNIDSGIYNVSIYDANGGCDMIGDTPAIIYEYIVFNTSKMATTESTIAVAISMSLHNTDVNYYF